MLWPITQSFPSFGRCLPLAVGSIIFLGAYQQWVLQVHGPMPVHGKHRRRRADRAATSTVFDERPVQFGMFGMFGTQPGTAAGAVAEQSMHIGGADQLGMVVPPPLERKKAGNSTTTSRRKGLHSTTASEKAARRKQLAKLSLRKVPTTGRPDQNLSNVFESKRGIVYRIPSLVWVPAGTGGIAEGRLLAFAEKRFSISDSSNLTIAMRMSKDGGRTWSVTRELFSPKLVGISRSQAVIGNPTVVVDRKSGSVVLLFVVQYVNQPEKSVALGKSEGSRWIFTSRSGNGGTTWSRPVNITKDVKLPHWTWYATGPGAAIQLTAPGPFAGRLVAPCNHVDGTRAKKHKRAKRSHLIFSDDGGKTWRLGARMAWDTNECAVAELANGTLLINSRDWSRRHLRVQHVSHDGGRTIMGGKSFNKLLPEPKPHGCQAAMVSAQFRGNNRVLVFSNPAASSRRDLTMKVSYTDGRFWTTSHIVHVGRSGYSALTVLPGRADVDGGFAVGCLFERGRKTFFDTIAFTVVPGERLLAAAAIHYNTSSVESLSPARGKQRIETALTAAAGRSESPSLRVAAKGAAKPR